MSNFDSIYKRLLVEHYIDMNSLNNQLDRHIENEIRLATNINIAIEYMEKYIKVEDEKYNENVMKEFNVIIKLLREGKYE